MDDYPRFDMTHPELLEKFLMELRLFFDSKGVVLNTQKRGILYRCICEETRRYLAEWVYPNTIELTEFDNLVEQLQRNIRPTVNQGVLFNSFVCRFQKEGETGGQYVAALHSLVAGLQLGWHADRIVLYQLKRGLRDPETQKKLYAMPNCDLQEAKEEIHAKETSNRCVQSVNALTSEVHAVSFQNKQRDSGRKSSGGKKAPASLSNNQGGSYKNLTCFRCGEPGHSVRRCNLGYDNCKCTGCGKVGHLLKACRSKKNTTSTATANCVTVQQPMSSQSVPKPVSVSPPVVSYQSNSVDPYSELFQVQSRHQDDPEDDPIYITLPINGVAIPMQFDDGAQKTVMAESTFRRSFGSSLDTRLAPVQLYSWGCANPHSMGSCVDVEVVFDGKKFSLPLLISPVEAARAPTLLGRNWIRAFWGKDFLRQALQIDRFTINAVQSQVTAPPKPKDFSPSNLGSWAAKFPCSTGQGTGRYRGPPVHLHLKPEAKPKYQPARSIPFPLTTRYNEAVDQNISSSVWVPVEVSEWASGLVPVQKRNGTLRLCADYKSTLNPALLTDSYCSPTVSEVLAASSGAKIFGELDCREAYLQIPVDEESSMLMVINSKRGLFRPTTLQFGVKTAPAIYQRLMDGLLGKLDGIVAYQDNIYVFASDFEQYTKRLEQVLLILSEAGIRLNTDKCTWIASSLQILGFQVNELGIHPTQEKIQAIVDAPTPHDEKTLQSLLGLISFYGRFFKGKATILEPLHRLLDKGVTFQWGPEHQEALLAVKNQLTSAAVLVHYDLKKPLVLACDASPVGVGAVLSHISKREDGVEEHAPILFASRTLSKAERNYSQLDKEALAIIFGVTKFHQYLFGRSFQILTDHKPLVPLLGANCPIPEHLSPRMVRWALKLGAHNYTLVHRPGAQMGNADFLSRCPLPHEPSMEIEPAGIFLLEARDWSPVNAKDIANASAVDPLLNKVIKWTKFGWPENSVPEEIKPYYKKKDELSLLKGCLLRGSCVVVPAALQDCALKLSHSLHYGIGYSKALARALIWWPGMSKEVEREVALCDPCQKTASLPPKSAPTCWPAAQEIWERVHLDYAGPVEGNYLLICIDAFSKWPIVKVVINLTASTLITHVRYIFADFGIPCTIVNDNGAQLVSKEFEEFLLRNNVKHVMSPPWHPASNGLAERTVRSVKDLLKKYTEGDFHARLARVLHSMRNRPSAANGLSPAEVMFSNRPSRSPLRRLHPDSWPSLPTTEPPLQPGTLVWALKRKGGKTSWEAGFVKDSLGSRVYIVQLQDGSVLKVSVDEVRRRLSREPEDCGRRPLPDVEPAPEQPVQGVEIPEQPVQPVQPVQGVEIPEQPVQPVQPVQAVVIPEQPVQQPVVNPVQRAPTPPTSPPGGNGPKTDDESDGSSQLSPPRLSPQGNPLFAWNPLTATTPRGGGRGRAQRGTSRGNSALRIPGAAPTVTRSGRTVRPPQRD